MTYIMIMEEETSSKDDSSRCFTQRLKGSETLTHLYRTNEKSVESTVITILDDADVE